MKYYNINEIINVIEEQRDYMIIRYKIEPNKIILGERVYSILAADSQAIILTKTKKGSIDIIFGLPITIDYENINAIEVCFVLEDMMRSLERFMV